MYSACVCNWSTGLVSCRHPTTSPGKGQAWLPRQQGANHGPTWPRRLRVGSAPACPPAPPLRLPAPTSGSAVARALSEGPVLGVQGADRGGSNCCPVGSRPAAGEGRAAERRQSWHQWPGFAGAELSPAASVFTYPACGRRV